MAAFQKHNVTRMGETGPLLVFSHGFGCDQGMWRPVAERLASRARIVLFDHVGSGGALTDGYDPTRHQDLWGYAQDVIELIEALDSGPGIFVGHSVSATIGVLAAHRRPDLFQALGLVCSSPRYTDTEDYRGGFGDADIVDLLDLMDKNMADWSATLAPLVAGPSATEVQADWSASVCRADPTIAKTFARATFMSDHRAEFAAVQTPTLLIDSRDDTLSPPFVGEWIERSIEGCRRVVLPTEGHSPHMTDPDTMVEALRPFVDEMSLRQAA